MHASWEQQNDDTADWPAETQSSRALSARGPRERREIVSSNVSGRRRPPLNAIQCRVNVARRARASRVVHACFTTRNFFAEGEGGRREGTRNAATETRPPYRWSLVMGDSRQNKTTRLYSIRCYQPVTELISVVNVGLNLHVQFVNSCSYFMCLILQLAISYALAFCCRRN